MPKAYLIGHITVTNPTEYAEYVQLDTPLIEAAGGRFLVRGGNTEVLEGNFKERHVVVEFPDMAAARAFYLSPSYQRVAQIRFTNADSDMLIVEGVS